MDRMVKESLALEAARHELNPLWKSLGLGPVGCVRRRRFALCSIAIIACILPGN